MTKIQRAYYAIIPADVRYSDISPNAKLLYGEITALCNQEGFCWASNSYFAKLYKTQPRTVSRWVGELKEKRFIYYEVINETKRKIYLTQDKIVLPPGQNCPTPPGQNCPHNNTIDNNTVNTLVAFDAFWKIYPRKTSKKVAQRAWEKLKPDEKLIKKIMEALPNHCKLEQWVKDDGRFIPHPATWLNQARWEDEIKSKTKVGGGRFESIKSKQA